MSNLDKVLAAIDEYFTENPDLPSSIEDHSELYNLWEREHSHTQ